MSRSRGTGSDEMGNSVYLPTCLPTYLGRYVAGQNVSLAVATNGQVLASASCGCC